MKRIAVLITFFVVAACSKPAGVVKESEIPVFAQKVNASFDDGAAELISFYTDPLKPQHGQSFKIVSFWRFKKQLSEGWKMFYHFEDPSGEQIFVYDHPFADGRMKELPLNDIIRDDAAVKELPVWFDSDKMIVHAGFFKGNDRMTPEPALNDGKNRAKLPPVEISKPKLVKKQMKVYAVAGESRNQIKIDGKLKESYWQNAQTGGKFWLTSGENMAQKQTIVRTAMDEKYFYVSFDCEDDDVYATLKNSDDKIYDHDDVVEIFVDGDGDKDEYWEMQVSAAGVKFDASFKGGPRKGMDVAWDSGIKFAVQVDGTLNKSDDTDKGWSAEIAIPWATIVDSTHIPPKDGDVWKAYMYRIDRNGGNKKPEFSAWVPPYKGDFHYLRNMGDLIFVYEEIL
ncbi:MAG TPA: carbohydrate-binding family 9-like protein [bacterium]|nr:carbohydrate-binding family 9-like protein [bacterium]